MLRRRQLAATSLAAAALAVAGIAAPGAASTSLVTVTVGAGALTVSAPATITGSGAIGGNVTLNVNGIAINDGRGSLAGWTTTISSTALTTDGGDEPGETIAASALTWTTTSIAPQQGQAAIALPAAGNLGTSAVVAVGLPAVSPGSFTANGTISFTVPNDAKAGEYTGTVTTTIS